MANVVEDFNDTSYNITITGQWARRTNQYRSSPGSYGSGGVTNTFRDVIFHLPEGAVTAQFWYRLTPASGHFLYVWTDDDAIEGELPGTSAWVQSPVFDVAGKSTLTVSLGTFGSTATGWVDDLVIELAGNDTTPPTTPTGLTVTAVTPVTVTLTWSPSTDNEAATGYEVHRDDVLVATAGDTTYTDTGLDPETTYTYQVRATDIAGNVSGFSNTVTATTDPRPDPPDGVVAVDLSSPPLVAGQETVTTAVFTPPAGSLLVALHGSDIPLPVVISNTGPLLDWVSKVVQVPPGGAFEGYAEAWVAPIAESREVAVSISMEDDYPGHALALLVVTGVDLDAAVGAVGQGAVSIDGAATVPLYTSTVPGSLPAVMVANYFAAGGDSVDAGWRGFPYLVGPVLV